MILVSCRRPLHWAGSSSPCAILRSIARSSCVSADTPQSNVTDARSSPSTEYVHIREGKAFMSHAKDKAVFYNKVQTFNRDMSILAVRLFAEVRQKELIEQYHDKLRRYNDNPAKFKRVPAEPTPGITVLDALSASGLRGVRYLKEIVGIRSVTLVDCMIEATDTAKEVCRVNEVDPDKVVFHTADANDIMYGHRGGNRFDVVDLDPFGSSAVFLDSAVQAVGDGGLLCITCTDMAVLAGSKPEKCMAKYGSLPLKSSYYHEMSLRILLMTVDSAANRHGRYIEPWISLSADFYIRVFVRIHEGKKGAALSSMSRMMVHQSSKCPSFHLQPLAVQRSSTDGKIAFGPAVLSAPVVCEETGGDMRIGGPFWSGPLHDQWVVDKMLNDVKNSRGTASELPTAARLEGVLNSISEELKDCPFYYVLHELFSCLHSEIPTMTEITSAIRNAGYDSSRFHNEPAAIKTNAPNYVVWDIMRAYCRLNPPRGSTHRKPSDSSIAILSKVSRTVVSFKFAHPARLSRGKYYMNPEPDWGPGKRGKRDLPDQAWDIPAAKPIIVVGGERTLGEGEPTADGDGDGGAESKGQGVEHDVPPCSTEDSATLLPSHEGQDVTLGDHIRLSRAVMKDVSLGDFAYGTGKKK